MFELLVGLIVLGVATIPWIVRPLSRAVPLEGLGWRYERLILGFFIPGIHLSERLHRLQRNRDKAKADLKKYTKQVEDEEKRLKAEVENINGRYLTFLMDWAGKRHWSHLWTRVPTPSNGFLTPLQEKAKRKKEVKSCCYTPMGLLAALPPEYKGQREVWWGWTPNKPPQNNNQKNRGGNQNQKQNNQNNQ